MTRGRFDRHLLHGALLLSVVFLMLADREFLGLPLVFGVIAITVLAIAYEEWTDGLRPLPDAAGNTLGGLIGIVGGVWALTQAMANRNLPLSVALIPFIACLIPCLTVVKILRRQLTRDFWVLHALGVVQVAIGCILGADDVMVMPLGFYAVMSLASLRSHLSGGIWPGWRIIVSEGALLGAVSLVGYLIMPNADVPNWNPSAAFGASRLATGFGTEMDLNHQGKVELDEEVVIEIDATDYSGRPTTIPLDQRFRAVELEQYRAGRWRGSSTSTGGRGVPLAQPPLPTLLVRQTLLNFRVTSREITTPVIADPALFLPVPAPGASRRGLLRRYLAYQQIVAEENKRDRSPLQDDIENRVRQEDLLNAPEALRPWAWELLESLADLPGQTVKQVAAPLPVKALKEAQWRPARLPHEFFEESAQRLCRYLALGGEYTYTLDLDRTDPVIDPAVDFLKNTKRGHCERFASGLALMLRSVGIPSRVVKGFRGCESIETGRYVIRNYHAHSWVEALIPKFENAPVRRVSWDWLTLDPTPGDSSELVEAKPVDGWYGSVGEWLNQQQPLVNEFTGWWAEYGPGGIPNGMVPVLTLVAGSAAIFMLRRLRLRWIYAARGMAPRLRRLARRTGIRSSDSDTPMEVAQALATHWRLDPFLAEYADIPVQLAAEHYHLAYSGAILDRDAANAAVSRLTELERIVWYSSRRRRRRLV